MRHTSRFHGFFCLLLMGCAAGSSENQRLGEGPNSPAETGDPPAWGHNEGGMPAMGGVDVGRTGDGTHLSYWGFFWKSTGTPGVDPYAIYDLTVAGQVIVSYYDENNVTEGEQECHFVVNHYDENEGTNANSYLILQNVAGGPTPFGYAAVYRNGPKVYLCAPHDGAGNVRTFATKALAEADITGREDGIASADETNLGGNGCNTDVFFTATSSDGERWTSGAQVYGGLAIAGTWQDSYPGNLDPPTTTIISNTVWDGFFGDRNIPWYDNTAQQLVYIWPGSPDTYSVVVWTYDGGQLYYCEASSGHANAEAALAATLSYDDTDPGTGGCGGFAWSTLSPP